MKILNQIAILFLIATTTITYNPSSRSYRAVSSITKTNVVYVCDGKYATKYHDSANCRGLGNCKGDIVKMTIDQARNNGKTACSICCK